MATTEKHWINDELTNMAKEFGYSDEKAKVREYTEKRGFYAIIEPENGDEGGYKDLSFVVTPFFEKDELKACVVSLGVGSSGFENDRGLAHKPGTRRIFKKLKSINSEKTWLKTSFEDTTSCLEELNDACNKFNDWKEFEKDYNTQNKGYLPACTLIEFGNTFNDKPNDWTKKAEIIKAWLATYANMRKWAPKTTSNKYRMAIDNALQRVNSPQIQDVINEVKNLLKKRKFVVLQGAPGTGKTWNAIKISKDYQNNNVFFIQFHAETTYSDFVWGIKPLLKKDDDTNNAKNSGSTQFEEQKGVLLQAIEKANECLDSAKIENKDPDEVLLIIDEINRANLPNVLGPVFYLFEPTAEDRKAPIKIGDKEYEKLPDNLYVVATMNTADRSLAVVDFALRRRFAWYPLSPHKLTDEECGDGNKFAENCFLEFEEIFQEYASDEELNLQPGQSYFIVKENDSDQHMKDRMRYELMPLIKEYIAAGMLIDAKDRFYNLFLKYGIEMYE